MKDGSMGFFGNYRCSLYKGVLKIPSGLNNILERGANGLFLTPNYPHEDSGLKCLSLSPLDNGEERPVRVYPVKVYTNERINIPRELRAHIKISGNDAVVVIGTGNKIEIWNPESYKRIREISMETLHSDPDAKQFFSEEAEETGTYEPELALL